MSTAIAQNDPLSPFIRLTPSIYLVEPRAPPLAESNNNKTIVLSFWYSAPPRALVKYVLKYADLAPSARIIFILSGPRDFYLYPTLASHRLRLKPAVDMLIACQEEGKNKDERHGNQNHHHHHHENNNSVYIHLFSNGGLFTTAHLLLAYKHATGKPLPVSAVVLDSSPGRPTPALSIKAMAYALPKTLILRQIGLALLTTLIWSSYVTRKSLALVRAITWKRPDKSNHDDDDDGDDPFAFARKAILDPDVIVVANSAGESINMCYIYSDSDDLVPWKDVEEHAALAASKVAVDKGKKRAVVHLERFSGTPHVGHMRADPERYWSIVERYLL